MTDKIRIAHVAGGLTTGGVEAVLYNYFSHMNPEDYDLVYISYDTPDSVMRERFENIGFTVYEVTKKKDNLLKSCREVLHIMKKHNVQIVHSHMTLMCFITNILGRIAGAKVLISHSHLAEQKSGIKALVYRGFKLLTRITATHWMACSEDAAIYVFGEKNWKAGRVSILNNAIDIRKFMEKTEEARNLREKMGLSGLTLIGNVGRFTEQKNQLFSVRLFAGYVKKHPDSRLLLVGSGPMLEEVKAYARELGITDKVIFTGSDPEPAKYYQIMDLFLFPSTYEGLGIAAVEAQAALTPVLSSDVVPRAVTVTDSIRFLSLDAPEEEWIRNMEELISQKPQLLKHADQVKDSLLRNRYDIAAELDWLKRFYRKTMKKG